MIFRIIFSSFTFLFFSFWLFLFTFSCVLFSRLALFWFFFLLIRLLCCLLWIFTFSFDWFFVLFIIRIDSSFFAFSFGVFISNIVFLFPGGKLCWELFQFFFVFSFQLCFEFRINLLPSLFSFLDFVFIIFKLFKFLPSKSKVSVEWLFWSVVLSFCG